MIKKKVNLTKKFWSISTTVRNPDRLRSFLKILKILEGAVWDRPTQKRFQIMLIQYKLYGAGQNQFYKDLNEEQIELMNNGEIITYEEAQEILDTKKYVGGGDMRGRQSFNPLEKMGFVFVDANKTIKITDLGNYFLYDKYDIGEIFFKSFIKWQLPNPDSNDYKIEDGYNIKPFIATLHLIHEVNKICDEENLKSKGISRIEFALFALTLVHFAQIKERAKDIIKFRIEVLKHNKNERKSFIDNYITSNYSEFKNFKNAFDYSDNAIRYFRLTRYIYIRGKGYYIDLEPRRKIEIENLLKSDYASIIDFDNVRDYQTYLQDIKLPVLPWETSEELKKIVNELISEIKNYQELLTGKSIIFESKEFPKFESFNADTLKQYIQELREYRKTLQQTEIKYESQKLEEIDSYITGLTNIFNVTLNRPIELEKLITYSLNALNDALLIKPNYPVGDDYEPTSTAPANKADIECFYKSFNAICEVTLLRDRSQWFNEGQPIMRHLRDFETRNTDKEVFGVFIAPSIHRDTLNTYWNSVRYEYEGRKQKIIPITIKQFLIVLETLKELKKSGRRITNSDIKQLLNNIVSSTDEVSSSDNWITQIPSIIENWKNNLLNPL